MFFTNIYIVIPILVGLRPLGIAVYKLFCFIKILKLSIPRGECSSQMIRPVTLILRLLVNLSFAYLVTLTLASQFVESLFVGNISSGSIFMCFLLTYVTHVMLLSLISDMYHVLKFASEKVNSVNH
ncbi:unnamed protein product [Protopolystoma xenopodis]|uniref:Uncharacterized protein n=1 Tax=Protopolystoma xenopodis TaxID=117903 RepID=A0A448WKG8_9PLAT|nr:unnamed protein product [Protopolystoma xenopodis]